jgi:chorismate mutase
MSISLELEPFLLPGINPERPWVIAGPCSAESEEQVLQTARELSAMGIKMFRAGIWKPRTRPNAFEGYGSKALPWLKKVKEETGMYTATEVANIKHVYEALKWGIDILWVGARTTANPFAVQEIADTLRGVDIPVIVKNPVSPDVELWIGAIERLNHAGIKRLAAAHRGFAKYEQSEYRNHPQWQIPIELKRRIPQIPMITDPSHICGNRKGLLDISQRAMDLNFEGIIIESHINPAIALSDAQQQLTPADLDILLKKLILRHSDIDSKISITIEELREEIDHFDDQVMNILEKRMCIADKIGEYKKINSVTILQTKRWDDILHRRHEQGLKKGLSEEFVTKLFEAIHEESINHQTKVMNALLDNTNGNAKIHS